jgi:hypothetical protein
MHASHDTRLVRFLDGFSMSFAMLGHAHSELQTVCPALLVDKSKMPVAFWLCWSFVDAVHRIRELAQAVPGLGRKPPELRTFLDATTDAEQFRNYIQHLRSELSSPNQNTCPVWGVLSWVDPHDSKVAHIALAGSQVGETQFPGCVYDTVNNQYVSRVCLSVNRIAFDFDPVFAACMQFRDFIIPWLQSTYAPGIALSTDFPIVSIRVTIKEPSNSDAEIPTAGDGVA